MVSISLCMIVRDEEKVLARCLDSVKNAVDEIILVDTGSSDRTKEIALRYTDKVYEFSWIDDFSAARNYSFSKAACDYCMWLDADDILPEPSLARLLEWKASADGTEDALMMKYITGFDEQGNETFSFFRERILKRSRNFRWKGRVHETIAPAGTIHILDAPVEHHSIKTTYSDRNLKIYEKMRAEGEQLIPRDQFYYARELYYNGQYAASLWFLDRYLKRKDTFHQDRIEAFRFAAYASYRLDEPEEALKYLMRALSVGTPDATLCCDLGKHYYDRKEWSIAAFWYEAARSAAHLQENGGFQRRECSGYLPCLQLSVCYDRLGMIERALAAHEEAGKWKPYGKEYQKNSGYFAKYRVAQQSDEVL